MAKLQRELRAAPLQEVRRRRVAKSQGWMGADRHFGRVKGGNDELCLVLVGDKAKGETWPYRLHRMAERQGRIGLQACSASGRPHHIRLGVRERRLRSATSSLVRPCAARRRQNAYATPPFGICPCNVVPAQVRQKNTEDSETFRLEIVCTV